MQRLVKFISNRVDDDIMRRKVTWIKATILLCFDLSYNTNVIIFSLDRMRKRNLPSCLNRRNLFTPSFSLFGVEACSKFEYSNLARLALTEDHQFVSNVYVVLPASHSRVQFLRAVTRHDTTKITQLEYPVIKQARFRTFIIG